MNIRDFWIEFYRPKTLDDLCVSDDVKSQIREFGKNMPNLMFIGNPGSGKCLDGEEELEIYTDDITLHKSLQAFLAKEKHSDD